MKNVKKLMILSASILLLAGCAPKNNDGSSSTNNSIDSSASNSTSSSSNSQIGDISSISTPSGQKGNLTSAMIEKIGNANITVTGVLSDFYFDNERGEKSQKDYDIKVELSNDKWTGYYSVKDGKVHDPIVESLRKGKVVAYNGLEGNSVEKVYINKDNEVAYTTETLYDGTPLFWTNQHLYNHLGALDVNKFSWDAEEKAYTYEIDPEGKEDYSQDQYLMAYLEQSLTPLLSPSEGLVDNFYVYLNDDNTEISSIKMMTEVDATVDEDGNVLKSAWSEVTLSFSNIGTTVVSDPAPYESSDKLQPLVNAINKMKQASNYTFSAVENQTYGVSGNDNDYEIGSSSSSSTTSLDSKTSLASRKIKRSKVSNDKYSTGTIGRVGQITSDAALFCDTKKHSFGMDDKLYYTEYSGYKQNSDNTFDKFEYQSSKKTLVGTKKFNGNISSLLPMFDFAPEVFKFKSSSTDEYDVTTTKYVLRDAQITKDIAKQISAHGYVSNATSSMDSDLYITVDSNGNIISTSFPYNISGNYIGYVTTKYSKIGTTTLDEDLFDDYIARNVPSSWDEYTEVKYYPTDSTLNTTTKSASEILSLMYGDNASKFITPKDLTDIFGDGVRGPWHNKNSKDNGDGTTTEYDEFNVNICDSESVILDDNNRITNWEDLMSQVATKLGAKGYTRSSANCMNDPSRKFETFVNGDIQIVFENIGYRTIYLSCYKTGYWNLTK